MGKDWDRLGAIALEDPAEVGGFQDGNGGNAFSRSRIRFGSDARQMQEWHLAWATEALRVLKPGGHLLAFGGTRTYHRLVCAVEDAGFEIRDTISWLYGSGFPKSLDVGKAIDRQAPRVGMFGPFAAHYAKRRQATGLNHREVCEAIGAHGAVNHGGASTNWEQGYNVPTLAQWNALAPLLELSSEWLPLIERVEAEREKVGESDSGLYRGSGTTVAFGEGTDRSLVDVTAPATPEAERWQGWGTALKPAMEPVVVARKPLSGTVAGNVLEHGVGALNVDGCRVATDESLAGGGGPGSGGSFRFDGFSTIEDLRAAAEADEQTPYGRSARSTLARAERGFEQAEPAGRWPANVVLSHTEGCVQVGTRKVKPKGATAHRKEHGNDDALIRNGRNDHVGYRDADGTETVGAWSCTPDCPVRLLDEQTGELTSGSGPLKRNGDKFRNAYGTFQGGDEPADVLYGDTGGASRFFYVAKASRGERNAGLEGFEEQRKKVAVIQTPGVANDGEWEDGKQLSSLQRNSHPTVKPISLMRWLVRLVTPPGGTVLDPFCGSGTTGCACAFEAFDFIGLERQPEYVAIAEARIAWWHKHRGDGEAAEILAAGELRDEVEATGQLGMFD